MPNHYNYIITGAGCAGLSLLMRLMQHPFFRDKKILVIDQSPKTANDRTWCFWEKEPGIFESIIHHQWQKVNFFSDSFSSTLDLSPYQYKMIHGIDLYLHVKKESVYHPNIEWRYEKVKSINSNADEARVELEAEVFTADYIFNSILFKNIPVLPSEPAPLKRGGGGGIYLLLQHFKGWVIETKEPSFDPGLATFMDFRVNQTHGTTFIYLMPSSTTTALVEYTLFTKELLPKEKYENALRDYISSYLNIQDYTVTHEEFGVIPMTNMKFPLQEGRVVYTGIAGGQVKGSSGYAFQFIQKRAQQIIDLLLANNHFALQRTWTDKKFLLYDSVLLNVLYNRKMNGDEIFSSIFQKNPAPRVLRFLDNESNFYEDLQIMRSVPTGIFLPAALHELIT